MSRTRVGPIFITPERATGIRVDGSYGDLQFDGTMLDSTHRTAREVLFTGCSWGGFAKQPGYTPPGTPAIYAARTAADIKVHAPLAPHRGEKLLWQETDGVIATAMADDWTLRTG